MSFQPPRLATFVRVPRELRMASQLQRRVGTKLAPAGLLALVAAGCGGVAYFKQTQGYSGYDKIAIIGGLVLAVLGGALALVKQEIGAPIAAGAVTPFMAIGASYIGAWVNSHHVLDPVEAKLFVAAGVIGLIAAIVAVAGLAGDGAPPLGIVIALLAVVPPICLAALLHIDDVRAAASIGSVVGSLCIAAIIAAGASRGRLGGVISVIAAALWLPGWIRLAKEGQDRRAASLAALLAVIVIIALGLVLIALAMRTGSMVEDPDLITDTWQTEGAGPIAASSAAGLPTRLMAVVETPRIGPVVRPVGAPLVPVPLPTLGQWAADPYGRYQVRYWNGKKWTDHVASNGITGLDPVETESDVPLTTR